MSVSKGILARFKQEEGQAIVMVAVGMSIFLLAAVGLGIDGSHIYAQRQMAQAAADAAAQAGISSIFNSTATFPTTGSFTCTTTDARTPCAYAILNGFPASSGDAVTIDYPGTAGAQPGGVPAGVALSPDFAANLMRATVTRPVNTTLMRLLGPTATMVKATATAAIVSQVAPVPILVTHPSLAGSFSVNGTPTVKICGGPKRSIQVNSFSGEGNSSAKTDAITFSGSKAGVDLSHAGPPDTGNCATGTGGNFGVWGGPVTQPPSGNYNPGNTGTYQDGAFPIPDPLGKIVPPTDPNSGATTSPATTNLNPGQGACPANTPTASAPCVLYQPGHYAQGIAGKNNTLIFSPGIYYITNSGTCDNKNPCGFSCTDNCIAFVGPGTDPTTKWSGNVMFYSTGPVVGKTAFINAGTFNIGSNANVTLTGSPAGSSYKGILFFEDRQSIANTTPSKTPHTLGGGGTITLVGTIYLNNSDNSAPLASADATHYQELDLGGTSGGTTTIQGEIIVNALSLGGTSGITMNLNSNAVITVDQIALVN
jgi:hypothetical protein